jgi:hypothetical protein
MLGAFEVADHDVGHGIIMTAPGPRLRAAGIPMPVRKGEEGVGP